MINTIHRFMITAVHQFLFARNASRSRTRGHARLMNTILRKVHEVLSKLFM